MTDIGLRKERIEEFAVGLIRKKYTFRDRLLYRDENGGVQDVTMEARVRAAEIVESRRK